MSKKEYGVQFKPIVQGDEEGVAAVLLESKNDTRKPPVLYPSRTLHKYPSHAGDPKLPENAKFLMDKFNYSGFNQTLVTDGLMSKHSDKYRVMMGSRNIYDELEYASQCHFPAELRRFFSRKRGGGPSTLAESSASMSHIANVNKKQRLEDMINEIAMSAGNSRDFEVVNVQNYKEKKKSLKDIDASKEGEEEEEPEAAEEEDEFAYSDDDDDADDYAVNYQDDDEEGHDAYGDDDADEGAY